MEKIPIGERNKKKKKIEGGGKKTRRKAYCGLSLEPGDVCRCQLCMENIHKSYTKDKPNEEKSNEEGPLW